jgi:two-component system, LytTR family, response regulator
MNCIIIDDEPRAIDILQKYIENIPFLHLVKSFRDPMDAINFIHQNKIDLILLDINMPNMSGIQIANLFHDKVSIIFTTAYPQHAVEGFNLDAIDFLLKPITFERFLKGVSKAIELKSLKDNSNQVSIHNSKEISQDIVLLKSGPKIHKVTLSEILFLEKEGNYFNIHTIHNKKILIRMNFFDIFRFIPQEFFVRVHKSYIVNLKHVDLIESQHIVIRSHTIPIGITYKEDFLKLMKV